MAMASSRAPRLTRPVPDSASGRGLASGGTENDRERSGRKSCAGQGERGSAVDGASLSERGGVTEEPDPGGPA